MTTLELTDEEVTMLFYMAGLSANECEEKFPHEYHSFMKKLTKIKG